MKSILKIIAVLSLFSINQIDAQQVVKIDTIAGTPLSISMDKRIDDLIGNIEDKCATKTGNTGSGTPPSFTTQAGMHHSRKNRNGMLKRLSHSCYNHRFKTMLYEKVDSNYGLPVSSSCCNGPAKI